ETPTPTATATATSTATATATITSTPTGTATATPTSTRVPPSTPTATPLPTATPGPCAPRPAVGVQAMPSAPGLLTVRVSASTAPATPGNALSQIQFGAATNALILAGSQEGNGGFAVGFAPGTQQTVFYVRRVTAGQSTTVPFVVTDACGAWPSLVG